MRATSSPVRASNMTTHFRSFSASHSRDGIRESQSSTELTDRSIVHSTSHRPDSGRACNPPTVQPGGIAACKAICRTRLPEVRSHQTKQVSSSDGKSPGAGSTVASCRELVGTITSHEVFGSRRHKRPVVASTTSTLSPSAATTYLPSDENDKSQKILSRLYLLISRPVTGSRTVI